MNSSFAQITQNLAPRPIVEQVINYLTDLPKVAVDCGCGAGNESAFLLDQGFSVYAFDSSEDAEKICLNRFSGHQKYKFNLDQFETYQFPQASLIIALFSLFFCKRQAVSDVLNRMTQSIIKDGILLIQVLGHQDAWVIQRPERFWGVTEHEIQQWFADSFEIMKLEEFNGEKPLANGSLKFWHIYTVILKKRI